MQIFFKILFIFLLFSTESTAQNSSSYYHETSGTSASLISSYYQINGSKKLIAGVEFKLPQGWKIYGQDDSGMGMPPQFDFKSSPNYLSHQVIFPEAKIGSEQIGSETINYKYYSDYVIFPVFLETNNNQTNHINLKLDFAICKEVCVPVSSELNLDVSDIIDNQILNKIQKFSPQIIVDNTLKNSDDFNQIDMTLDVKRQNSGLLKIIALAIFGGLILNIMPCVLPVLSIKLIGIIKHSGAPISRIRFSFLATIIGILSCFVALSLMTYTLQTTGNSLGWGFQFQNPVFLIFLIIILTLFIAELLGIFEITFNQFIANLLNKKISDKAHDKNIFMPNFLSGILAVLLATPCSAPFLGTAISFAVTQDFLMIFTIFIFIGLGFAAPYFVLIISPNLISFLPKPGKWMVKIKHLMAGFLFATAVWLTFVLSKNIGILPSLLVGLFAALIFLTLKIKTKITKIIVITILCILAFTLPFDFYDRQVKLKNEQNSYWLNFDENILRSLVAQNKVILVDVTADWCLTCKFNKILVLNHPEIINLLKNGEVIGLRADITKPDSEVMKFLAKHNRYAIPFNAVYGPNAKDGLLTSEFLNRKHLLDLIASAK